MKDFKNYDKQFFLQVERRGGGFVSRKKIKPTSNGIQSNTGPFLDPHKLERSIDSNLTLSCSIRRD